MTKLERQQAAISVAVRVALHKIGLSAISRSEFFGTKQLASEDFKKAA